MECPCSLIDLPKENIECAKTFGRLVDSIKYYPKTKIVTIKYPGSTKFQYLGTGKLEGNSLKITL